MDDYIKRCDAIHDIEQIADTMSVCLTRDECNGMRNMKQLSIAAVFQTHAADVVEVVRCKDCRHLEISGCYGECSMGRLGIVSPEDYCSRADMRGEKNDQP